MTPTLQLISPKTGTILTLGDSRIHSNRYEYSMWLPKHWNYYAISNCFDKKFVFEKMIVSLKIVILKHQN